MTNKLVLENLRHRPVRTALSVIAVGVQVTMILTLVGISYGMLDDAKRRAQGLGADIWVKGPGTSLLSFSTASMQEGLLKFFRQQPHIVAVTGSVVQPLSGVDTVTGIDLDSFNQMNGGFKYVAGGPFQRPGDIIVDEYYASQKHVRAGSTVDILNRPWRVCGVVEPGKLARIVVPIAVLQDLTGNTGKLSQIFLKVDDPNRVQEVVAQLKANPRLANYQIYSIGEVTSMFTVSNYPGLSAFIDVVIGISVVIGFLVVFLSMYTAVLERTREIGILKALGASPAYVLSILMRETLALAFVGIAFGIVFTYGTRWLIMTLIPASLPQMIVKGWWPIAGGIAVAGAILGAIYPGLKAARQDAIEALSYE